MEPVKMGGKIVAATHVETEAHAQPDGDVPAHMSEALERPEVLEGRTYKIKPGTSEHAIYITINDVVLNAGTQHEQRRPFEMFINSKNMESFQWVVALTRLASGVFRKGGDVTFLAEELRSVFAPKGGYFLAGGKWVGSEVCHIGLVIEQHLEWLGMRTPATPKVTAPPDPGGRLCPKCLTGRLVRQSGCDVCIDCGDSKCE